MIHPHTELKYINEIIGYGIFATEFIPEGTITWTKCKLDISLSEKQVLELPKAYLSYILKFYYIDVEGNFILCWDHGKYMNHHCDSNTMSLSKNTEIAVRDIVKGEQITCEYGTINWCETLHCSCGDPECRSIIHGNDMLTHYNAWDNKVKKSIAKINKVAQLLSPFVQQKNELEAIALGKEEPVSHKELYYPISNNVQQLFSGFKN